eukprot:15353932-Ditylum_brightwellii.AAC.1
MDVVQLSTHIHISCNTSQTSFRASMSKEASGSVKPSDRSVYGMPPCRTYYRSRSRCHPCEGKKWACESKCCVWEPVCNTTCMGGRL